MEQIKFEQIQRILRERKNQIGLVGADLEVSVSDSDTASASITPDWRKISIVYGKSTLVPDAETRDFVAKSGIKDPELKMGENFIDHETGHRENPVGTLRGCPYSVEMHDAIKESIFRGLEQAGKQNLANYVTNAFEDVLDNVNCRTRSDFAGHTLHWNNQGLTRAENGKFNPFYEAFVRANLLLGSEVKSYTLLKRFFQDSPEVKTAIQGFLGDVKQELDLEHTVRLHEKPAFENLFTRDLAKRKELWTALAYSFAKNTAELLEDIPEEKLFGSSDEDDENSDDHNPFDREMKLPPSKQGIAKKRYEAGEGPALHRERKEQLYDLYRAISKEIRVDTTEYSESQGMPLVHFGRRFLNENDRKLRFKGLGFKSDGSLGVRTARHNIEYPVNYKIHKINFPKLKIVKMDRSGSMTESADGNGIGDTSFIPWGDKSKYHFALKGYFGIDNFLERQGIAPYVQAVALGFSGEETEKGFYKDVAKSLLETPSGGTAFDIERLERELDKSALVLSISDGECSLSERAKQGIEKKLNECDFAHIQIGGSTGFSQYLESRGVPVFYVKGDNDLSGIMVNFVSGYYKAKQGDKQPQIK